MERLHWQRMNYTDREIRADFTLTKKQEKCFILTENEVTKTENEKKYYNARERV